MWAYYTTISEVKICNMQYEVVTPVDKVFNASCDLVELSLIVDKPMSES